MLLCSRPRDSALAAVLVRGTFLALTLLDPASDFTPDDAAAAEEALIPSPSAPCFFVHSLVSLAGRSHFYFPAFPLNQLCVFLHILFISFLPPKMFCFSKKSSSCS